MTLSLIVPSGPRARAQRPSGSPRVTDPSCGQVWPAGGNGGLRQNQQGTRPSKRLGTLAFWALRIAVVVLSLAAVGGCDRSCSRLADKLCEQASTSGDKNAEEQCESWKARTRRVSKESCQVALKQLDLQR